MAKRKIGSFRAPTIKKFLKSVYPPLTQESASKVSRMRNVLLKSEEKSKRPEQMRFSEAIRDVLIQEDSRLYPKHVQRDLHEAPDLALKHGGLISNVLTFATLNTQLHISDFRKNLPSHLGFNTNDLPNNTYDFYTRRSRDPVSMDPNGAFFLIFKTIEEACAFKLDTSKSTVAGQYLKTNFADSSISKYITLDLLNENCSVKEEIYKGGLKYAFDLENGIPRNRAVLVKGYASLTKAALQNYLFEYDYEQFKLLGVQKRHTSKKSEDIVTWFILFTDEINAKAFLRNMNGNTVKHDVFTKQLFVTTLE